VRGRGSASNPKNRFETIERIPELPDDDETSSPLTQFFNDTSKSIIAYNDSPDVGFDASINPYRGCEHGCIYCYARPTHEYLGFSAGLDFETKIMVKEDAPKLLRRELSKPEMGAAGAGTERCHRLLSTGGKKAPAHTRLPGSFVGVSQPGGDRHKKLSGYTGHRYSS
jgi:hypothetical protein